MAISAWNGLEAPPVSFAFAPLFVLGDLLLLLPWKNRKSDPCRHSRNTDGGDNNDEGIDRHVGGGRIVCAHRNPDRLGLPLRRRGLHLRLGGAGDRLLAAGTYRSQRGGDVQQDGRSRRPACQLNRKSRPFRWAAFRFSKTPFARCVIMETKANETFLKKEMGCSYQLSTDANPWHHQQGKENLDGGAQPPHGRVRSHCPERRRRIVAA